MHHAESCRVMQTNPERYDMKPTRRCQGKTSLPSAGHPGGAAATWQLHLAVLEAEREDVLPFAGSTFQRQEDSTSQLA